MEVCIICNIDMDPEVIVPGAHYKRKVTRYNCPVCEYSCIGRSDHEIRVENGEFDEKHLIGDEDGGGEESD